jgi:uncharacterized protein (UPF0371 family)
MNGKIGFDNEKYLELQSEEILRRVNGGDSKLYIEFGGKLTHDGHASRILPGYDPSIKMRLLQKIKDKMEVLLCIYAGDIERKKMRADFGITYEADALKTMDELAEWGINVTGVVITRFEGQPAAEQFKKKLERRFVTVYRHRFIEGYPSNVDKIVSEEGFGRNDYIPTTKPIVIVTGPGPNSGKLSTCLSQMYHDHKRGINARYAKFETFPVWNMPLKHPVNIAYEAATADLGDVNMIDSFHLETYGETAINYNRDIELFPVVKRILDKIAGKSVYNSPTDMGVNKIGFCITDDEVVREAAKQEIIRRYFNYAKEYVLGQAEKEAVARIETIMGELGIKPADRKVVEPARESARKAEGIEGKGHKGVYCGAAIMLNNGEILIGKNSPLMHSSSSLVLNSLKVIAGIPDSIHLLSPSVMQSIRTLKENLLNADVENLDLNETLIALGISAASNPTAHAALGKLKELRGCEVHLTHIPTPGDEAGLKKLGVNYTSDPLFSTKSLFIH